MKMRDIDSCYGIFPPSFVSRWWCLYAIDIGILELDDIGDTALESKWTEKIERKKTIDKNEKKYLEMDRMYQTWREKVDKNGWSEQARKENF